MNDLDMINLSGVVIVEYPVSLHLTTAEYDFQLYKRIPYDRLSQQQLASCYCFLIAAAAAGVCLLLQWSVSIVGVAVSVVVGYEFTCLKFAML